MSRRSYGQIADARSRLLNATSVAPAGADGDKTPEQKQAVIDANNSFGGTIGRLLSLQENYPALRSNEAFMKVQDELSGTENRINAAANRLYGCRRRLQYYAKLVPSCADRRLARI